MASNAADSAHAALVVVSGPTSGFSLNLHPLPILNISDHYTRARLSSTDDPKLIGALLGTQSNRDVSIVNSFELIYAGNETNGDVSMDDDGTTVGAAGPSSETAGTSGRYILDTAFLESRREQFKQVFPTLDVIGWYSVGKEPSADDVLLHQQFSAIVDTPIFLLFDKSHPEGSQDLPIRVYEAALTEGTKEDEVSGKFVKLEYGVETGEAERIAVDGVSRGGMGESDESSVVGSLTTQRNAIRMMYERILVISQYISDVINNTIPADHTILRQISSLTSTLPTIDATEFRKELATEYGDSQLTSYLSTLTVQLNALSEYIDKHQVLYPSSSSDDYSGQPGPRGGRGLGGSGHSGRRRGGRGM